MFVFIVSTLRTVLLSTGRFLKDVNNGFHLGSGISFHELIVGVKEVDEAR